MGIPLACGDDSSAPVDQGDGDGGDTGGTGGEGGRGDGGGGQGGSGGEGGAGGGGGGEVLLPQLVVVGTFGGTLSVDGVTESLAASTDADAFAFLVETETGERRLSHVVAGRTAALQVLDLFWGWHVCGELEQTIEVLPGTSHAWSATSEGGSDIFCARKDGPFLIAGPGEERFGGRSGFGGSISGAPEPGPFVLFGGASEGAAVVRGASRTPLPASRGGMDAFVADFAPEGELGEVTTFGSAGDDMIHRVHGEGGPEYDVEMVGTFGRGEAAATATFGDGEEVTVTSLGGADVFVAVFESMGQLGDVIDVVAAGGPSDDTVSAYGAWLEHGPPGSAWTRRAVVGGAFPSGPFGVDGLDPVAGICDANTYALELTFPNLPEAASLAASCHVALSDLEVTEEGAFAAGDHGPGAELDLGQAPIALPDPPVAGHAAFVGWFPRDSGGDPWRVQLSSTVDVRVADLCTMADPSTLEPRWVAVGSFEGTTVFAEGTPEEETLEADGIDAFVAQIDELGRLVHVTHLAGPGDQRATSCQGL